MIFEDNEIDVIDGMCEAAIEQYTDALRILPNSPDATTIATINYVMKGIRTKIAQARGE